MDLGGKSNLASHHPITHHPVRPSLPLSPLSALLPLLLFFFLAFPHFLRSLEPFLLNPPYPSCSFSPPFLFLPPSLLPPGCVPLLSLPGLARPRPCAPWGTSRTWRRDAWRGGRRQKVSLATLIHTLPPRATNLRELSSGVWALPRTGTPFWSGTAALRDS